MSRLIKKSIAVPEGVEVAVSGEFFVAKGAKGKLKVKIPAGIEVAAVGKKVRVKLAEEGGGKGDKAKTGARSPAATAGTTWSLVRNAMQGVSGGYAKTLEIEGVGYRAALEGEELVLHLGYALPVRMPVPEGVAIAVEKNTITVSGIDKELVGRAAAEIRARKKHEPYKGKGIHYRGEVIRRKVGKKVGTTTA